MNAKLYTYFVVWLQMSRVHVFTLMANAQNENNAIIVTVVGVVGTVGAAVAASPHRHNFHFTEQ